MLQEKRQKKLKQMVSSKPTSPPEDLPTQPVSLDKIPTSKIAVPESQNQEIPVEKYQKIRKSLTEQGTNLNPIIVRRRENDGENENSQPEYEVVRGVEWCKVAKELDIQELSAWVYQVGDKQAQRVAAEMDELALTSLLGETTDLTHLLEQLEASFDKKLDSLSEKIHESIKNHRSDLREQLLA